MSEGARFERLAGVFREFSRPNVKVLLLVIILIGSILRFIDLGAESLWLDEAFSIDLSSKGIGSIIETCTKWEVHPPLYFILLHYWMDAFGISEKAVRTLSALLGILTLPLFYLLGKTLFNPRTGFLVCFISAISVFQIHYAQEARPYGLLLLLSLLSYLLFIRLLERYDRWTWFGYCLCSILLGYTHVYGSLILAAQCIYFLLTMKWRTRSHTHILLAFGCVFLFLVPMIYFLAGRAQMLSQRGFWITKPNGKTLLDTLINFSGSRSLLVVFLGLVVVGFFGLKSETMLTGNRKTIAAIRGFPASSKDLMLVVWLSISVLVPYIWSQFLLPIYLTRYLIGAMPAFFLLVSNGLDRLGVRAGMYLCLCLISLLSVQSLHKYYANDIKEQWREVSALVKKEAMPEMDGAILCDYGLEVPFRYYYHGDLRTHRISRRVSDERTISKIVEDATREKQRLWLILGSGGKRGGLLPYVESQYGSDSVVFRKDFAGPVIVILFTIPQGSKGQELNYRRYP